MGNIVDVIAKLKNAKELDIYQGNVLAVDIEQLATLTGCVLPDDYVHFLKSCGFASWLGHSVFGIFDASDKRFPNSFNFSALEQTSKARQLHAQDQYPFHEKSVVIGRDGMGGYFLLLSKREEKPNEVIWVNQDESWVITQTWPTFTEFLANLLSTE